MPAISFPCPLLVEVLRNPERASTFDGASWGLLLRQARTANVTGRALASINTCLPAAKWPIRAQQAFQAEKFLAEHRMSSVLWELEGISQTIGFANIRPVILKGAAYIASGHEFALYRHFGDIDILIPRSKLEEVERLLNVRGWISTKTDPYDQQYYRRWMHELPPMQHIQRGTCLDVHHAISPLTARFKPKTALLFASAIQAKEIESVDVLSPIDMFLHATVHLFSEGDQENALRNLLDLHDLLDTFSVQRPIAAVSLVERADELDLTDMLALGSRHLERVFGTTTAICINEELRNRGIAKPRISKLDWMFDSIFLGTHPSYRPPLLTVARTALYIRGHLLRMPINRLVVHLIRKAWIKRTQTVPMKGA